MMMIYLVPTRQDIDREKVRVNNLMRYLKYLALQLFNYLWTKEIPN